MSEPDGPDARGSGSRLRAGAERSLDAEIGTVRTALLQGVRALGCTVTIEQFGRIEAERGSKLSGLTMTRSRLPLRVRLELRPEPEGCTVAVLVEDRWPTGLTASVLHGYGESFTEVLTELDAALRRSTANGDFSQWWRDFPEHQMPARSGPNTAERFEQTLRRRTSRLLDGPRKQSRSVTSESGLDGVRFVAGDEQARVDAGTVDAMLTAGQLIGARPGAMPSALVDQVRRTLLTLEGQLADVLSQRRTGELVVELDPADRPAITFLGQQAALRTALPVRLLMTCTTCRLERVVNPDLARMQERSRRIKVLSTSVGAVFGSHHVSPFILVGRLAAVKKSEPDFVCQRCQGTDADQTPITFCPACGERQDASVLRTCPKCDADLRTRVPTSTIWTERDREPRVPPPPFVPPGWYVDPWGRYEHRYWDGDAWTPRVASGGTELLDAPAS